jgi:hypothetical protein
MVLVKDNINPPFISAHYRIRNLIKVPRTETILCELRSGDPKLFIRSKTLPTRQQQYCTLATNIIATDLKGMRENEIFNLMI